MKLVDSKYGTKVAYKLDVIPICLAGLIHETAIPQPEREHRAREQDSSSIRYVGPRNRKDAMQYGSVI